MATYGEPSPKKTKTNTPLPRPTSAINEVIQIEGQSLVSDIKENKLGKLLFIISAQLFAVLLIQALGFLGGMQGHKWEYKIISPGDLVFDETLNKLGDEGWELVTARRAKGSDDEFSYEMILKKKK